MKSVTFGPQERERLTISVLSYACPATGQFYDDNWLVAEIRVRAGAFRGKFQANFLTSELVDLHAELARLYTQLHGGAAFEPMEGQLNLKFSCDNLGHIHVAGLAMDEAGIGHRLTFSLSFDQTYLAATLQELSEVVRAFPVRT
jgi:hypothetical protein